MNEQLNQENFIITDSDLKQMIETRNISPEDYFLIKELSQCPKKLFLRFHNFFTLNKADHIGALEGELRYLNSEEDEKRKFLELYLELAKKYDWSTCWNINSFFEKRKN